MRVRDLVLITKEKAELASTPYIEIGDIDLETKKYGIKSKPSVSGAIKVRKNDILISTVRPTRGAITIVTENQASASNAFVKLRTDEKVCKYKYLFYALNKKTFFQYLGSKSKGATYPTCSSNDILDYEIKFVDIMEQEKIVYDLDTISSAIENRKQFLRECDELIKSLYYEATSNNEIKIKKLSEIGSALIGLTYSPKDISESGNVVLRSGNIKNGSLDFSDIVRVSMKNKDTKKIMENDILICSRNGSKELVGKSALIPKLSEEMYFGAFMAVYRSKLNRFLIVFFQSDDFKKQLAESATATINQITNSMLNNISVKLPSDDIISSVTKKIDAINKYKELISNDIIDLDNLLQSKTNKYFEN